MAVRRGSLYLGVFLLAVGAVTLAAAAGVIARDAVADAVVALWPLAVIAIGVGLVLRRSPAALAGGLVAALVPGLALGATVVAAPAMQVPCRDAVVVELRERPAAAVAADSAVQLGTGTVTITTEGGCK